ncbi:MAG: ATPase [Odoribacter sp.]|nr:ATPase [Odoribacter sp.]
MKKLSLLIFYEDYQQFLDELREKGVVHIQENKERSAEDERVQNRLRIVKRIGEMIMKLNGRKPSETPCVADVTEDELLTFLSEKYQRLDQINQQLGGLQKDIQLYSPWGDFSREQIEGLNSFGWDMRFFTVPDRRYNPEWEETAGAVIINEEKGNKYFVTVNKIGETPVIDADPFIFPDITQNEANQELEQLKTEKEETEKYLDDVAVDSIERLKIYRERIYETTDELNVENASDLILDDKIIVLEGWVPMDREAEMEEYLQSKEVYYTLTRPTPEDDVPIKLKNNFFNRLFEPITEMYSLPNYGELDPTPFFAPFFMLFFGLCMGDGGYGLLIWLTCLLLRNKVKPGMRGYLRLGEYLGISTMIVGLLTGSFFGISLEAVTWPWLKGVKDYFITEANYGKYFGGYNPLMFIAFGLGIIQILFGMYVNVLRITKQFGFKYALSTLAWLVGLTMCILVFGLPLLKVALPLIIKYAGYAILALCALIIIFYNTPGKSVFSNIGNAVWNTYNMASGLLGDILSYVRLFALGLTGSILGGVFNSLAFDLTAGLPTVIQFMLAFIILLIGHSLNFALCFLGALVHPMRLTFVEFYKNAGFEGGGKKYEPFRKRVE